MPAERTMARQEALALADRRDDAQRDVAKARAALRRWVGARADEALDGDAAGAARCGPSSCAPSLHRHAEIAPYTAMQAAGAGRGRRGRCRAARRLGLGAGLQPRGPQYGDMVSFQLSFDLPWQTRAAPAAAGAGQAEGGCSASRPSATRRCAATARSSRPSWPNCRRWTRSARGCDGSGLALAAERVALALASYQAGRGDLGAVLVARREARGDAAAPDRPGRAAHGAARAPQHA